MTLAASKNALDLVFKKGAQQTKGPSAGDSRPDLKRPGTLRNPDGTEKPPEEQLKQLPDAQKKGKLIESTTKSKQNVDNMLDKIKSLADAPDE